MRDEDEATFKPVRWRHLNMGRTDGTRRGGAVHVLPDGRIYSLADIFVARRRAAAARADELERLGQMRLPHHDDCSMWFGMHKDKSLYCPNIAANEHRLCIACMIDREDAIRHFVAADGRGPDRRGPSGRAGVPCPDCDGRQRTLFLSAPRCAACEVETVTGVRPPEWPDYFPEEQEAP